METSCSDAIRTVAGGNWDLFGDATAPDSGFNRIIGEEKIRERERRKRGEDSDIGTEKAKPACYCSSLSVSDALSVRERRRLDVAQMPIWDGGGDGGSGGGGQLPWMT